MLRFQFKDRLAVLGILGVVTPVLLLSGLFGFAAQIDAQARTREQQIVTHGFLSRVEEQARVAVGQAVWDDAVEHLQAADEAWADFNVGEFFSQSGFEFSAVADPGDHIFFVLDQTSGDKAAKGSSFRDPTFEAAITPMLAKLRAREKLLAPVKQRVARGETIENPVQETNLVKIGGHYYSIAATLAQPDRTAKLLKGPAPILIIGEEIEGKFLSSLSSKFLLSEAAIVDGATDLRGFAEATFLDADGKPALTLAWKPQTPGMQLLIAASPLLILAVLALAGISWFFHSRTMGAVQQLVASEKRASHLAYHDPLTGLPNRAFLSERLVQAIDRSKRQGRPFAVHCIDLDRFKDVNDTFGHQVGDELIRKVAGLLTSACRSFDTVARLGGDEFAIIQDDCTPEKASDLADRLVKLLAQPVELSVGRVYFGCSIGIMLMNERASHDPQECLREADLALYRAKERGRGQYCFFETEMDAAIQNRRALQNDLRDALKNGELVMVYQPQVNGKNKVTGVEALMRWTHGARGSVSPAIFIPLAEECGLIEQLGWFAMRRAFEDGARWPGIKIGVNVSASQLRLKGFLDEVKKLVDETGIDTGRFEFEITEGLLLADSKETHEVLAGIRAMGFQLALDDFGTGYSSLSYLKRYPITRIKIDKSFISNLGQDAESGDVVSAIVRLARALKMAVVAEGVETDEQRACLASAGCRDIQGYLASKPLPVDKVQAFIDVSEVGILLTKQDAA